MDRTSDRAISHQSVPHTPGTGTGIIALLQRTRDTKLHQSGLGDIDIEVYTIVPTVIIGIGVIILQASVSSIHTLLVDVAT